jgi:hypothetical protein
LFDTIHTSILFTYLNLFTIIFFCIGLDILEFGVKKLSTFSEIESTVSINPFGEFAVGDQNTQDSMKENDFLANALFVPSHSNDKGETEEFGPTYFQCDTRRGVESEGTDVSSVHTAGDGERDSPIDEVKLGSLSQEHKRSGLNGQEKQFFPVTDRLHSETTQSVRSKQHPPVNK